METEGILIDFGGTIDTDGMHWYHVFARAYCKAGIIDPGIPEADAILRDAYVHAERRLGREHIIEPDFTFRKTLQTKLEIQRDYLISKGQKMFSIDPVLDVCYSLVVKNIDKVSRPVLESLSKRYPMVLVTNFYGNMPAVLQEFGLSGFFKAIVESATCGVRKPDPEIFRLGCRTLGIEPSYVTMIGDSLDKDIEPAAMAGCHTVWLKGQSWTDAPSDVKDLFTIHSLAELCQERSRV